MENDKLYSDKGIFYNGQFFDAYTFDADIIRSAKSSITLLDNYVEDTVLTFLYHNYTYETNAQQVHKVSCKSGSKNEECLIKVNYIPKNL